MFSSEVGSIINALSRIGGNEKPSFFNSKYEKFLFILMLTVAFLIGCLLAFFYITKLVWLKLGLLILTLMFYLVAMLWQLSLAIPMISFLRNPTGDLLKVVEASVAKEVSSMTGLATVSTEAIQYVADRLILAKSQLSTRMSFLVGAVDKVGVLPGVVASLLAVSEVSHSNMFKTEYPVYLYIALALFVLYGFSVIGLLVCQKFEIYAGILEHYLQYRTNSCESSQVTRPK